MNLNTILLLGSIIVPAVGSLLFFGGFPKEDSSIKKLSYFVFGFPFIASILLFFNFDPTQEYCFEILYSRMGLQELGITLQEEQVLYLYQRTFRGITRNLK